MRGYNSFKVAVYAYMHRYQFDLWNRETQPLLLLLIAFCSQPGENECVGIRTRAAPRRNISLVPIPFWATFSCEHCPIIKWWARNLLRHQKLVNMSEEAYGEAFRYRRVGRFSRSQNWEKKDKGPRVIELRSSKSMFSYLQPHHHTAFSHNRSVT